MLSCQRATELIEKKSVLRLSVLESLQLRLHKSICDACTNYEKQSNSIDALLQKDNPESTISNPSLQEKIRRQLP
jgi:hypothetical protein